MKKTLLGTVVCLLALLPAWGKELVVNGSFEEGDQAPTGWVGSEGARWEEGGRTGKCAVLGPAPQPSAWVTWKQEIPDFRPDTTYEFSAWVKADRPIFAQVVVDGLKPHQVNVNFFYFRADTTWRLWRKDVIGDPTSSPAVTLTLLNEGGPETFYFDDVSLKVRDEVPEEPVPIRPTPEVDAFREAGNLISNGEFEVGEGDRPPPLQAGEGLGVGVNPAGWFHGDPALLPRTGQGKYVFDPWKDTGRYAWEKTGYQSDRCVSVTVPGGDGWGGWNTQVHDIQPNTDYTLSFWTRLDAQANARVLIFGQELRVRNYFAPVPWHWALFSATVNSGGYAGDCNLGFVAEPASTTPVRLWIDRVQLFAGRSPIGDNVAWMVHYLYGFTWLSPDAVAPVAFAGEWQFAPDQQPPEVRYVVEIPKEVECTGVYVGRLRHVTPWGILWTNPDEEAQVDQETVEIDGRPYVRYVAHQTQLPTTDPKGFANECIVPVEWRGLATPDARCSYCATNLLWLYLTIPAKLNSSEAQFQRSSIPAAGSIDPLPPLFYHAEWDGGQQLRQKLAFQVTQIPAAPPPKRLVLIAGNAPQAPKLNPQFLQDYARYGLNGLDGVTGMLQDTPGALADATALGLRYFAQWTNQPAYGSGDPEAKAMGMDGQRNAEGWCLEYRGPDWTKRLDALKALMDVGVNTFLFDDASPSTCHCARCKQVFREFLQEHGLEYVSPGDFLMPDWTGDPRYRDLWEDFPLWHYGRTAAAMKKELVEYAQGKGLPPQVYFGISSWLGFRDPSAAASLDCFDFDSSQTYINCYPTTPKGVGDLSLARQKRLGRYARPYVPTISPGLTYWHSNLGLDPHALMRDQILEMMMAAPKALGYTVYAGGDFDLGDMKYTAEANTLLARFEDLITEGEVVEGISINGTPESSVRAKKLGDELLVLVGDYSTYDPVATEVGFSLPQAKTLTDVETGETLQAEPDGTYKVTLQEPRLRLFYAGDRKR